MRRGSWFWGLSLLVVGFLFLLENIGIIKINVWNILWPILLILLGIWFLIARFFRRNLQDEYVSIPLDGANRANFHIKHGAGRLNIYSGVDAGYGLQGTFTGGLEYSTQQRGDLLDITLQMPELDFPFLLTPDRTMDWSFGLTKDIPLALKFDTGANQARIDLKDANVTDIALKTGASATEMILPSQSGFTRVDIHSGAASLKIHIPQNVAANIKVTGGLSNVIIDRTRFPKGIDSYRSSDYDSAINKADLNIEMGAGSVIID